MTVRSKALILVVAAVAACTDAAAPVPASLDAVVSPGASLVVATTLATAPTFEVRTAKGKAIKNIPVTIAVTQGGGTLTGPPTVTVAGPTSIGTWTLGTATGAQTVTVTVADLPVLVFETIATAGAVSTLDIEEGDDQRTGESTAIPLPIRVRVEDSFGNGVPGVTVNWAVTSGGGGVAAPTSITNASGIATSPTWTLGLEAGGAQLLVATVGSLTREFSAVVQEPAASITVETAPPATVAAGTPVVTAPTFVVRDAGGNALNGVPVTVTVTAGGGSLSGAPLESSPGPTSIGTWTVGTGIGAQSVTVAVAGIPSAVITTTTVPGSPSVIVLVEGEGVRALAGTVVGSPLRVRVDDAFGNPIPSRIVTWDIIAGGGSLADNNSTTNGSGVATAPAYTLGRLGGAQVLRGQAVGASLDILVPIETDYVLDLRYNGAPPNQAIQDAFTNATNRIRATIVGALSLVSFPAAFDAGPCVSGVVIDGETIPGVRIYATVAAIDGPGGTLGSAGPCYTRNSNSLTVVGRMTFDVADMDNLVAAGTIESVILHEMLHVVGIGTLWATLGLRPNTAPSATPIFLGALATDACRNDHEGTGFCTSGVPVEDCLNLTQSCGGGTINSHWKESVFRTELMTGFASAGLNPFSKMSIQSLADMGYTVNVNTQDSYTVPPPALMSLIPAWSQKLGEPTGPIASVDANGRIVQIFRNLPDDR